MVNIKNINIEDVELSKKIILWFGKYKWISLYDLVFELKDEGYINFILDKWILKWKDLEILEIITWKKLPNNQNWKFRKITIEDNWESDIKITFQYTPEIVEWIKWLKLWCRWNWEWKFWTMEKDIFKIKKLTENKTFVIWSYLIELDCKYSEPKEKTIEKIEDIPLLNPNFKLFPFQKEGVWFIISWNKLLADDMGLWKTLQSISAILYKKTKSNLIVCPSIVISNWKNELMKYISDIKEEEIIIVDGTKEKREEKITLWIKNKRYFLLYSYDSLKNDILDFPLLKKINFDMVILDEGHYIWNFKSRRRFGVSRIKGKHKIVLSWTPFSKSPDNIWSILNFLEPDKYKNYYSFVNYFMERNNWNAVVWLKEDKVQEFKSIMEEIMIRRMKKDVLKDLPDKILTSEYFSLPEKNAREYKKLLTNSYNNLINYFKLLDKFTSITWKKVIQNNKEHFEICKKICDENKWVFKDEKWNDCYTNPIFREITKLKNALVSMDEELLEEMPKVERILELVEEYQKNKRNIILFTSSVVLLNKLLSILIKTYWDKVLTISGNTSQDKKWEIVKEFQSNNWIILLWTIQSMWIWINLTNSDTIVYIDKVFDLKQIKQTNDRIYRIGQNSDKVQIISLVYKDTIDEFIEDVLKQKKEKVEWYLQWEEVNSLRDKFMKFLLKCISVK